MKNTLLLMLFGLLITACAPTRSTSARAAAADDKELSLGENEVSQEFALETYLQRTPGVTVSGSGANARVQVRGVNSFSGNTQPLFIVNGTDVGNNYSAAVAMLRGMKIKSVRVLKDSDASLYGVRGAGGVIVVSAQ